MRVIDLADSGACPIELVGGKARGLGLLVGQGLPVPPGFCVTTEAYREHVLGPEVAPRLALASRALVEGGRPLDSAALLALCEAIVAAPIGAPLRAEIALALDALARRRAGIGWTSALLAVRSSAVGEDLAGRSFAGQHRTTLEVDGLEACLLAVRECWASLWTDGAVAYRQRGAGPRPEASMAVLVQALVPAEAAGVLFTECTVGGVPDRIVIESTRGLGDVLVSGRVTPDRSILARPTLDLIDLVPALEGAPPSLDDASARDLARLSLEAEALVGVPLDVEWALAAGRVWLLQARPITARLDLDPLPRATRARSSEDSRARSSEDSRSRSSEGSRSRSSEGSRDPRTLQIWTNLNTGEVLPDVVTPLTWSIVEPMVRNLLGRLFERLGLDIGIHPLVGRISGRAYFQLNTLLACVRRIPGMGDEGLRKLFGGREDLALALASLEAKDLPDVRFHPLRFALRIPGILLSNLVYTGAPAERLLDWARGEVDASAKIPIAGLSLEELVGILGEKLELLRLDKAAIDAVFPALGWISAHFKLCARWLAPDGEALAGRLLAGLGTNDIARAGLDLARLSRLARADPRLEAAVLATTSFDLLRQRIAGIPAASSFLAGWDEFLDAHGHHARGEIELAKARWVETPDEILCQLQGLLRAPVDADFLARFEGLSSVRILAEAEVRRRLGFIRRKVFGVTLRKARRFLPLRENYKNQLVRGLWLLRRLFLEMGARLVEAGTLRSPDDVFFLELEEFHSLCGSSLEASEARRLVGERRASYERDRASEPRPIVYVGGDLPVPEACPTRSAGTVLRGIGVHPGVVRGPARVILRSGEDSLRPGEILVAPFTDPGWTPYFLSAAAIVVDTGGILSHGSIVAREFGIPTAVNVGPATTSILTGQLIEVDGTRGTVRILGPEGRSPHGESGSRGE